MHSPKNSVGLAPEILQAQQARLAAGEQAEVPPEQRAWLQSLTEIGFRKYCKQVWHTITEPMDRAAEIEKLLAKGAPVPMQHSEPSE